MNKVAVYFLVLLYAVAIGKPVFPILGYWINKDYIVQYLCVQKDNPENECQGQCHLGEEVSKAQENEKKDTAGPKFSKAELEYYYYQTDLLDIISWPEKEAVIHNAFSETPFVKYIGISCFHPPEPV